jgi:hypothetical protein
MLNLLVHRVTIRLMLSAALTGRRTVTKQQPTVGIYIEHGHAVLRYTLHIAHCTLPVMWCRALGGIVCREGRRRDTDSEGEGGASRRKLRTCALRKQFIS